MAENEKTKVFISWSGKLSHEVAIILRKKLPAIIQSIEVFFSSSDIQKGENGIQVISDNLKKSQISIIILTKENKDRPWILFEAGCIHGHGGQFCSLLIDVATEEIIGPLSQFQHTSLNKEDFFNLLCTVNEKTNHPIEKEILRESLEGQWKEIENTVNRKIRQYPFNPAELEAVDAPGETIEDYTKTIEKYSDGEIKMALHCIMMTYCCGLTNGIYNNLQECKQVIKWDLSYMKHVASKCVSIGLMIYNPVFHTYTITDKGKDFMLETGLFSTKGYCIPREAHDILKEIGKEYLVIICRCLFGVR